ncbi:MAG: hypothetical protein ACYC3I_19830 [Gemmataceae bacterium]
MIIRLAAALMLFGFCLSAVAAEDKPEQIAKAKAEEIAQATVKGDYGKILDLTYPELVKRGGGRAKLIESMTEEMKDWKSRGIVFRSAKVGATAKVVPGGDKLFSVVPLGLELKVPGGILSVSSFLLGISSDKGKTWSFINGDKAHEEVVKKMLPDLPPMLKLPERKKPVFKND